MSYAIPLAEKEQAEHTWKNKHMSYCLRQVIDIRLDLFSRVHVWGVYLE